MKRRTALPLLAAVAAAPRLPADAAPFPVPPMPVPPPPPPPPTILDHATLDRIYHHIIAEGTVPPHLLPDAQPAFWFALTPEGERDLQRILASPL